jgi:hypothetical protein
MRGVADDTGNRLQAEFGRLRGAHQHHGGSAVGDRRRVGRGDRAVLLESRLQSRDLFDVDRKRAFVLVDHDIALAPGNGDRGDFPGETAVVTGLLGAGGRADGEFILRLAAETIRRCALFGKGAHQRPRVSLA